MTCTAADDSAAAPVPAPIRNAEIDAHELLDDDQRLMLKVMRTQARRDRAPFTMLDFAQIALRAAGVDFAEADPFLARAIADTQLRKNAVLYVYEVLRATDNALIREWPEFDEMLRCLEMLAGDLP
jgi:hypothetical protein